MNFKNDVIDCSIQSLKSAGFAYAESFRPLLEQIYECGYSECRRNIEEAEAIRKYSAIAAEYNDGFFTPVR